MPSKQQSKSRSKSTHTIRLSVKLDARDSRQLDLWDEFCMFQSRILEHASHKESVDSILEKTESSRKIASAWAIQKVSTQAVAFMAAFCRRDLTSEEISKIGVFIDAAYDFADEDLLDILNQHLDESQSVVRGLNDDAKLRDIESADRQRDLEGISRDEGPNGSDKSFD